MNPALSVKIQTVGAVIRDRRERLGLRQIDVADEAYISRGHYHDIERGRARASRMTYMRIAEVIHMTPDEMDALIEGQP